MKNFILKTILLAVIFNPVLLFGQNEPQFCAFDDHDSKKYPWRGNNAMLIENLKDFPLLDSSHIYFRIPVTFHIFKSKKISNEFFYDDIKNLIFRLNKIYSDNKTGFAFYVADIVFYEQDKHFVASYYTEAPFISSKDKNNNSINVYYVDVLQKNFLGQKSYFQGVFNPINKSITIIKHSSKTTLAHEIGHFFGLKHPHRNWQSSKRKQESVSRTRTKGVLKKKLNCEVNGDFLSDTPAEPDLTKYSDSDCNYNGDVTDKWGDKYNPNINNIMSYTANRTCRTNFTNMQKSAMLYTAKTDKHAVVWKSCPDNIHFQFDSYEPDNNIQTATLLVEGEEEQYHTFHAIPTEKNCKLNKDNFDFFALKLNNPFKIKINIKAGTNSFPKMLVTVMEPMNDTIFSEIITSEQIINIDVKSPRIQLIIQNLSEVSNGILYDYFIKLENIE